jgi:signal transduction histidine kinase/ActR/RegA family two-component response regulator
MHVYLLGLITKDGKECHINLVDITERKKNEEELKETLKQLTIANSEIALQKVEIEKQAKELLITNKELEQSLSLNTDKNLFISILAHDLISPFSVLLGLTELLLETIHQIDLVEIENIAKDINQSAKNTFVLLEDMLKWARMQSGRIPFESKKMKFADISNEVIKILHPYAISKNITLINSLSHELYVFADRYMLNAVFRNLVSNAIKFSNQNGIVEISAIQSESNLVISVSDNGIGIAPERLSKLFDISQFESTAGTAKEKGTGLGLLICKQFVEKHGGRIWAESKIGKGSTFYFDMPFKAELKEMNVISDHKDVKITDDLKILIVDDQYSLRLILGEMIKQYSREIIFASSGEEAIESCRNNPDLDLIIMDFQMSQMNGYEASKEIRLFNKEVIIILQTAFEHTDISDKIDSSDINGYYTKPYNKLSLLHLITKHFNKDSG